MGSHWAFLATGFTATGIAAGASASGVDMRRAAPDELRAAPPLSWNAEALLLRAATTRRVEVNDCIVVIYCID
jgi:hypothetical protein